MKGDRSYFRSDISHDWQGRIIYIFRHTKLAAQKARVTRMLNEKVDEVTLHGLGAAISRTINVALQIQRKLADTVQLNVRTGTIKVNLPFFSDLWYFVLT